MEILTNQVGKKKYALNHEQLMKKNGKADFLSIIDIDKILSWDHTPVHKKDDLRPTQNPQIAEGMDDKCRRLGNSENHVQILTEYQDANLNRRLQIYLQLPQLKSEFEFINGGDPQMKSSVEFQMLIKSFAAQMGMALGSAAWYGGAVP